MNRSDEDNLMRRVVTRNMRIGLIILFGLVVLACGAVVARLIYINVTHGRDYSKAVLVQRTYQSRTIASKRGSILDRNGIILARSEKQYNVIIDPHQILDKDYYIEPSIEAMVDYLGYDEKEIRTLIYDNPDSSYIVYERDADYSRISEYKKYQAAKSKVTGVWFEEEFARIYPYSSLASHVLGFVNADGNGSYGLEQYYNTELSGVSGLSYTYFDSELKQQKIEKEAMDGYELVTTLDYNVERIVEEKVKDFLDTTGAKNIGVIVMDPNDASILAMASNREYNLNDPRDLSPSVPATELMFMSDDEKLEQRYKMWKNYCISDTYEPGSTFKTITVSSALDENVISTEDTFSCAGYTEVGGWRIGCNNKYGHGTLTLTQSLMKSCNCALMEIAAKLGKDSFYKYQSKFGFGAKTGIDLPGESSGILIPLRNLNETELATSSFGTTFNVTMIQIAAAYASIINGGTYYQPHVVREVRRSDKTIVSAFNDMGVRQTISEGTASFIRNALFLTVESGTATPAKVEGYLIGGKTGTAQKRPREEKRFVVSFAGFAPVTDPRVLIYIVIDEVADPELSASSSPATKLCASIMKEILPYLGVYPDGDIDYHVDLSMIADSDNENYDPFEDEKNPFVLPDDLPDESLDAEIE
ncbi:MAG: peptidoglycan glycosyltransferase [Lachnospiraceae bacterium]|nr:peptidoglycan glycosyltransferase [Lachnospiraceae bacterium]